MITLVKKLWSDESGQGLVEYALIIALVAIFLVAALTLMRGSIADLFGKVKTALDGAA